MPLFVNIFTHSQQIVAVKRLASFNYSKIISFVAYQHVSYQAPTFDVNREWTIKIVILDENMAIAVMHNSKGKAGQVFVIIILEVLTNAALACGLYIGTCFQH